MRRDIQVRVRLMPVSESDSAVQVRLQPEERDKLEEAARKLQASSADPVGLSTYIREAGVAVALRGKYPGRNFAEIIAAAAEAAGQHQGEWLRNVALASCDASALRWQLNTAYEAAQEGFAR